MDGRCIRGLGKGCVGEGKERRKTEDGGRISGKRREKGEMEEYVWREGEERRKLERMKMERKEYLREKQRTEEDGKYEMRNGGICERARGWEN